MLDFPSSPTTGQKYPASPVAGVPTYTWDGEKWNTIGLPTGKTPVFTDGSTGMTAQLTLITPPVAATDAASKAYVDSGVASANTNANNRVLKSGDTMTGTLQFTSADPQKLRLKSNTYGIVQYLDDGTFYFLRTAAGDPGGTWNAFPFYIDLASTNITMSGSISVGGTINGSGTIIAGGKVYANSNQAVMGVVDPSYATAWGFWHNVNAGTPEMAFGSLNTAATPTGYYGSLNTTRFLMGVGTSYKPGGGPWTDSSDARIKNVLGDYTNGLDAVTALHPIRYTFKGNDAEPKAEGALYSTSPHQHVAESKKEFIGLIAQEAQVPMPEMVSEREGVIDGSKVNNLLDLDSTALTYALVNAVKELKARVEQLEGLVGV